MENSDFNDILKSRAEAFKLEPSHVSFESIMAVKNNQKNKVKFRLLIAAIALLLVLLGAIGIYHLPTSQKTDTIANLGEKQTQESNTQLNSNKINITKSEKEAEKATKEPISDLKDNTISTNNNTSAINNSSKNTITESNNNSPKKLAEESKKLNSTNNLIATINNSSNVAIVKSNKSLSKEREKESKEISNDLKNTTESTDNQILNNQKTILSSPKTTFKEKAKRSLHSQKQTPNLEEPAPLQTKEAFESTPSYNISSLNPSYLLVTTTEPTVDKDVLQKPITFIAKEGTKTDSNAHLPNNYGDKKNKVKYGFDISLFNRSMLINNAYNGANNSVIKNEFGIAFDEKAKSSYSNGILFSITRNNFSLGIGVANTQIEFGKIYKYSNNLNIAGIPIGNADSLFNLESKQKNSAGYKTNVIDQNLQYIEIPLILSYQFGKKSFTVNTALGTSFQWLTSTQTYLFESANNQVNFTTIDDVNDQRFVRFQIAYTAAIHAQYNIKKWHFFTGPILKVHHSQIFHNDFIDRPAPLFIGVESGVKFSF